MDCEKGMLTAQAGGRGRRAAGPGNAQRTLRQGDALHVDVLVEEHAG